MVRRHPHVFGSGRADTPDAVVDQWDSLKRGEDRHAGKSSALDGVPRHLPALHRAQVVLRKAGRTGFEWPELAGALAKVREELAEVEAACAAGDRAHVAEELGDLLLAVVNVCRWQEIEAEDALQQAIRKFVARFQCLERDLGDSGRALGECTTEELSQAWRRTAADRGMSVKEQD
jgi:tetrapyrrole methylase family protein/MazG family protein